MKLENAELFESAPVSRAMAKLILPTVLSQLVTVAYNMADTFFIGQTGDPNQVAATNLCLPLFIFLGAISNIFGIGGSSLIARCLGMDRRDKARNTSAFCLWTALCAALCYGLLLQLLREPLLRLLGADEYTTAYCHDYLFWTVTIGSVPTVASSLFALLLRAEGLSKQAGFGVALGAILNIILDPIFIFSFGLNVKGAAIATMLSNLLAALYFVQLILRRRQELVLTLNPRWYSCAQGIPAEVILVGLPSSIMSLMATLSNTVLNKLMASYCNEAVAGIGIAKKIDLVLFFASNGIAQGVLPLVSYTYSAKNYSRMLETVKKTFMLSVGVSLSCSVLLFTCAGPLVRLFIDNDLTVEYGRYFQRIIAITGPCISVVLLTTTLFQAVGMKKRPLILSFMRKGGFDIPFMLVYNAAFGLYGIVWATTTAEILAMVCALIMLIPFIKRFDIERKSENELCN
ncbi:MAG: MATE family efflux transporter [Oscillospiraceae bacterium]|nr:MATE family efflux transporter [Oscillospiraceae bacterium]